MQKAPSQERSMKALSLELLYAAEIQERKLAEEFLVDIAPRIWRGAMPINSRCLVVSFTTQLKRNIKVVNEMLHRFSALPAQPNYPDVCFLVSHITRQIDTSPNMRLSEATLAASLRRFTTHELLRFQCLETRATGLNLTSDCRRLGDICASLEWLTSEFSRFDSFSGLKK